MTNKGHPRYPRALYYTFAALALLGLLLSATGSHALLVPYCLAYVGLFGAWLVVMYRSGDGR